MIKLFDKIEKNIPGKVIVAAFLFLIVLSYTYFNIGFKPELQDNAWTNYWAYDYVNNGIVDDRFIGNGLANLRVTGVTPAFLYGHILNVIGWTLPGSLLISTLLILGAQGIWILILKDKNWSRFSILLFLFCGFLLDAYFEPAHTSKTDAFTFFMLSLSFLAFTRERYLSAGFLALVCFESHPIGLTVFFYMLGYFLGNRKRILEKHPVRPFVLFFCGIMLGLAYYLMLHHNSLFGTEYSFQSTLDQNESLFHFSSYIVKYFIPGKISKHLPELLIIVSAVVIGIRKKYYLKDCSIYWILALVFLSSFLNPHPVHTYVLMAYPAMLMVLVDAAARMKLQKLLLLTFFILMLPQFLYLTYKSLDWPPHKEYVNTIRDNLPEDKTLPVLGSINEWFACVGEREYHHYTRFDFVSDFRPEELYLVVENNGRSNNLPDKLKDLYRIEPMSRFDNHGELFEIYYLKRKQVEQ